MKIKAWDLYLALKNKSEEELKDMSIVIEVDRPTPYLFGRSEWINEIEDYDSHIRLINYSENYNRRKE